MKIMEIVPVFTIGGVETMVENLCTELKAAGHEVIILSLFTQHTLISDRIEAKGLDIRYLDKKVGFDRSIFKKIRNEIRKERPDVVHTHLYTAKYAQNGAAKENVPARFHTVHNMAKFEIPRPDRIVNRFLYKHRGLVPVALSKQIRRTIAGTYAIDQERIPIVLNGVPLENCIPKEDYSEEATTFVHVGRFTAQKNHAGMIRAFEKAHQQHPNINLYMYGDGPLIEECRELVSMLHANDYIHFCGVAESMYEKLCNASVFLLPSTYEGVPMTLIEAMGAGLPIITTNVGGIPDMLTNGVNAIVIDPDERQLTEAICRVVKDSALRERLGRAAREHAPEFSAKKMCENYTKLYEEAVAKNKK